MFYLTFKLLTPSIIGIDFYIKKKVAFQSSLFKGENAFKSKNVYYLQCYRVKDIFVSVSKMYIL